MFCIGVLVKSFSSAKNKIIITNDYVFHNAIIYIFIYISLCFIWMQINHLKKIFTNVMVLWLAMFLRCSSITLNCDTLPCSACIPRMLWRAQLVQTSPCSALFCRRSGSSASPALSLPAGTGTSWKNPRPDEGQIEVGCVIQNTGYNKYNLFISTVYWDFLLNSYLDSYPRKVWNRICEKTLLFCKISLIVIFLPIQFNKLYLGLENKIQLQILSFLKFPLEILKVC